MGAFIEALLPVFSLIILGYVFQRYQFPGETFWPLAAKITYFAFFPALVLSRLALADLGDVAIVPLLLAVSLPPLAVALALVMARPLLPVDNPAFTSVFQGSIRFNTYVGLATAAALFGDQGVALAAIILAILIPLVNVLCVAALTHYVSGGSASGRDVVVSLVTNPLIIACAIGIVLNWSGIGLPWLSGSILEIFSRAALPLGLLTVGAGLDVRAVQTATMPVAVASVLKLLVVPLLAVLACRMLALGGDTATIVIMFAALPTAPSAYILAQQLGGDVKLMAGILTIQTMLAALTMAVAAVYW
jgi:hypothetical protein